MDGKNRDRLLTRLDERTARIEDEHLHRLEVIEKLAHQNADDIDDLENRVGKHSVVLGGMGTGLTALLLWVADKVTRII